MEAVSPIDDDGRPGPGEAPSSLVWEAFDQAPALIAVVGGPDHVFEYANRAYRELVGDRPLIGRPALEALPEYEGQGFIELLDAVSASREPYVGTEAPVLLRREPGGPLVERFVDFVYQPLFGPDGAVTGVLAQGVDVTDRALAQRELAGAHRDNDLLMEHSRDVLCLAGADGRFTRVSAASEAVFGYRPEELVGRPFVDLIHPDDRAAAATVGAEIRAGTRVYSDLRHVRKDGTVVRVRWSSVWSEAEQVLLGVARDRTDADRQEAALREADDRLRLALDGGGMAVWDWDLATDAVACDARLRALWGLGPGEIRAADLLARIHPDDGPEVERVLAAAVEARSSYAVEFRVPGPDGDARWLAGPGHVVVGPDGSPTGLVGVNFDVTERKRAEAALRSNAARATFRAALGDAVRPLDDPLDIQEAAAHALGEHLGAARVHYAEAGPDGRLVVARDYHVGVASAAGTYTIDDFGADVAAAYRAGRTLAVGDVRAEPGLTAEERAAYEALSLGAYVGVPLVKGGRLVGLLVVHQSGPRAWTADEVALIEETAERTWAAVERARAEGTLRESEGRYRTLFTSIDEGFCVIEVLFDADDRPVDYRFLEVNPAFELHTGLTDAVGRTIREMAPGHEARWFEAYGRVARTGEPARFVDEAEALGRWYDVFAFPIGDPDGARVAVLFNDVSERERAEREVRALNAALEGRVAEGTRQVRELAARLTVAEQAERERIAHVLHDDLQQQLFGAAMTLAALQRDPSGDPAGALAGEAVRIVEAAARLARSLSAELAPAVLQGDLLGDLLEWVATEKRAKYGLDVAVEVRGAPPLAGLAARVLLYQALREALFNVVKHSGGMAARIVGWAESGSVVVRVEDDGAGFDVGAASAARGGFGLASVRERIEVVGGRFEVQSAPGGGTRVTVSVPATLDPPSPT